MRDLPRQPAEWTFVGRKDALERAIGEIEAGARGIAIAAPPGAGRTRLAHEIANAACARELVDGVAFLPSTLAADAHELAAEERTGITAPRLLLVVDDAHRLADDAARAVERRARRGDVFVLVTLALGRPAPESIRTLWKDALTPLVEIAPLVESEIAVVVESALRGHVERGTQRLLWRASQGNLIWLRELLREGLRRGVLERRSGIWRWSGPVLLGAALREVVMEEIAALCDSDRRAIEAIAIGERIELRLLGAEMEPASIERLERLGLVAVERDGLRSYARVARSLQLDALREAAPQSRTARIRAQLGRALLAHGLRRPGDRVRAAAFLLDGEPAAGLPLYGAAAEEAWAQGNAALAERLARAALHGADPVPARHVLAEALADQGRFEEAIEEWDALEGQTLDERTQARVAASRAAILAFARGRVADAQAAIDRALASIASKEARQLLTAMRALTGVHLAEPARAWADVAPLLDQPDLPPYVETRVRISACVAANALGRFDRVLADRPRALRAARLCKVAFPLGELWTQVNSFYALLLAGDLVGAEQLAADQREREADAASATARAYWTQGLGIASFWRGRLGAAIAHFDEAAALLLDYDNGSRQGVLLDLAVAHAVAGAADEAKRALVAAEASRPGMGVLMTNVARARSFVRAAHGERSAARASARETAAGFLAQGRKVQAIVSLHDAVRFGDGVGSARKLHRLAAATDGPLLQALARQALGLAERDADALDAASEQLASVGAYFFAAEAASAACVEHAAAGRAAAVLASRARFEALASRCDGVRLEPPADRDPLTRREREVADLASAGASDREIAARLALSVRTVHAHLRAVYGKLGVAGREQLRTLHERVAAESGRD